MNVNFSIIKHQLNFKFEAGTSRGVLNHRDSFFLVLKEGEDVVGVGEASPLKGLSVDYVSDFESQLKSIITECNQAADVDDFVGLVPEHLPSIKFALETAVLGIKNKRSDLIFPNGFSSSKEPLLINGLIWMGDFELMKSRIQEKLEQGFSCLKLKIGAIDFEKELDLLRSIRRSFSSKDLTLRVDANGAFSSADALAKLHQLSEFDLHSIEQPIMANQWREMAVLCAKSPVDIALDEELIGVFDEKQQARMLDEIKPQFIILKPTLLGGFANSMHWIELAEERGIKWWITSALESNVGLNAISQFTANLNVGNSHQGLGTGQLYSNNIQSPLTQKGEELWFDPSVDWGYRQLF